MRDESKLWLWRVVAVSALTGCVALSLRSPSTVAASRRPDDETNTQADGERDAASGQHVGAARPRALALSQLLSTLERAGGVRARCNALAQLARSPHVDEGVAEQMAGYAARRNNMELRFCAITSLGDVRSEVTVPHLIELLDDPALQIGELAVRALAPHASREAREAVLALVDDERRPLAVAAAVALSEAGAPEAASMIVKLLETATQQDRDRLLYALGATHDPRALGILTSYVRGAGRGVQYTAIAALGELGGAGATRTLLALLTERPDLTGVVSQALARTGDPEARAALLSAAEGNASANAQAAALQALAELEGPEVQALMVRALSSEVPQTANVAAEYFASHADATAVPALGKLAREGGQRMGWMALNALGRIGGDEARQVLEEVARGGSRMAEGALQSLSMLPGGVEDARVIALERARKGGSLLMGSLDMLANDDSAEARELLIAAAKSKDPRTAPRALMYLGQRNDPQSRRVLEEVLQQKGSSREHQQAALYALVQSGDPNAAKLLNGVLQSSDPSMRAQAVSALAQLGGPDAERAVFAASVDKDVQVASSAASALAQMGTPAALTRLEQVVSSAGGEVSRQALQMLASTSPERAGPLAQALSSSRDPEARMSALSAVGSLSGPLGSRIVLAGMRDSDPRVVGEALNSILGDVVEEQAARAALLEVVNNKQLPEDVTQRASQLLNGTPGEMMPMREPMRD